MKKTSRKLKILSFNTKWDRFYEYVINELTQNFKTDEQVREIMRDVLMLWSERLLSSIWMNNNQFISIYEKYEKEIDQIRARKIDNRIWRSLRFMSNKMKKLLVCYCFDEIVNEVFREAYI